MKGLLLSILTMLLSLSCFAQKNAFGFKVGGHYTHITANPFGKSFPKKNMMWGWVYRRELNNHFSFYTGMIYQERGWKSSIDGVDVTTFSPATVSRERHQNYLSFPMLFSYSVGKKTKFGLETGIQYSKGIGGHAEYSKPYVLEYFNHQMGGKANDFGWVGGTFVSIPLNAKVDILTEAYYYHSWTRFAAAFRPAPRYFGGNLSLGLIYKY